MTPKRIPPKISKKVLPKMEEKPIPEEKSYWRAAMKTNVHFLVVLVLFAGFSVYAITSFFSSTNRYIDSMYASVVTSDASEVALKSDKVNMPPECQTCPPFPVCSQYCPATTVTPATTQPTTVQPVVRPVYEVFTDVMSDSPYAEALENLRDEGIITGYGDGSFKPDATINRAEFLAILTNAVDADFSGKEYENCFTDVKQDWFAVFVCYAKDHAWIQGYSDGSYRPASIMSKSETLKIVLIALGFQVPDNVTVAPFKDTPLGQWFTPYIAFAKANGIVNSASDRFYPNMNATRAQFVQMLYKAMQVREAQTSATGTKKP